LCMINLTFLLFDKSLSRPIDDDDNSVTGIT
jgi:hypothetical protein